MNTARCHPCSVSRYTHLFRILKTNELRGVSEKCNEGAPDTSRYLKLFQERFFTQWVPWAPAAQYFPTKAPWRRKEPEGPKQIWLKDCVQEKRQTFASRSRASRRQPGGRSTSRSRGAALRSGRGYAPLWSPGCSHQVVVPARAGLVGRGSPGQLGEDSARRGQWRPRHVSNCRGLLTWHAGHVGAARPPRAGPPPLPAHAASASRARPPRGRGGWGDGKSGMLGDSRGRSQASVEPGGNVSPHAGIRRLARCTAWVGSDWWAAWGCGWAPGGSGAD